MKRIWHLWVKALGEKASPCDQESDRIAFIRTLIFITYLMTNLFIVAGVIRHWNDLPSQKQHEIPKTRTLSNFSCKS